MQNPGDIEAHGQSRSQDSAAREPGNDQMAGFLSPVSGFLFSVLFSAPVPVAAAAYD